MKLIKTFGFAAALFALLALPVCAQPVASSAARLANLEAAVTTLTARVQSQADLIAALQAALASEVADRTTYADSVAHNALTSANSYSDNRLAPVADKLQHFSRSGNNVLISGANVYIRNGMGATVNNGFNGLGNLIVGYNESRNQGSANPDVRTGSHNLIVGVGANYARNASIITGVNNGSGNHYASVYGGTGNLADAVYSVVVGGYNNHTTGGWASILGGRDNVASSQLQHIP